MLNQKTILITGGTGSLGHALTQHIFENYSPRKVIIYSRDEFKQFQMSQKFEKYRKQLRFFIGDVRDRVRIRRAFEGVDIVIHTAALKQVPACEYNPIEAVKTNINGAENIINAAIDCGVSKVVALSTDKAVNPVNLYGATKLVSDRLFLNGNAYVGPKNTVFSVVRYGNVAGSRGSIIPYFKQLLATGATSLPITDPRMTRFWIFLDEGVDLVMKAIKMSNGGEVFISKIDAFKITDLALALNPDIVFKHIGIRPGEKIHELLIAEGEARTSYEYENHFVVYPEFKWNEGQNFVHAGGKQVKEDFIYSSGQTNLLSVEQLKECLTQLEKRGGSF